MPRLARSAYGACLFIALTSSCAPADTNDDNRAEVSSAGQSTRIELERDLTTEVEIGGVNSLSVDRSGRIYVADYVEQQILVFSPTGQLLAPLGRKGAGPGEYTGIGAVVAARGDSLFAFDVRLQRITAYAPGDQRAVAYTRSIANDGVGLASSNLLVPAGSGFVVQMSVPFNARASTAERRITVKRVQRDGTLASADLLSVPDRQALVHRGSRGQITVGPLPYGRQPFLQLGPQDHLVYGWGDSLTISRVDLNGRPLGTIRVADDRLPVTSGDLDRLVASYETGSRERSMIEEAVRNKQLPTYKPVYRALVADDESRLWVNVTTAAEHVVNHGGRLIYISGEAAQGNPGATKWLVFDASGQQTDSVMLPSNFTLYVVREGRAYGIETDDDGVEQVVRFRIRPT